MEPFRYKIYAGHFRYRLAVAVGALLLLVALSISCSSAPELRGGAADSKAEVAATPPLATSPDSVLCPECEPVDVVEVIDANTVRTSIGDIQMYGAYVVDQPADCAALAKERLTAMAGGAIRIEPGLTDTVRNNSAHYYLFTADGRSIEEQLVREGLTLIWTQDGEHMDGSSSGTPGPETLRPGACGRGIKRFWAGSPAIFALRAWFTPSRGESRAALPEHEFNSSREPVSSATEHISLLFADELEAGLTHQMTSRRRSLPILVSGLVLLLMTAGACGGTSEDDLFPQISDPGQTITVEMLQSTPFKQSKEYALEGLPGATYVGYGFLRVGGGDPYGYEVRFYESHQQAVELGTALAIEGSGKNAILDADEANYKEGVTNRRVIIGSGVGGGARSGIGPRFGSYVIFGNIVMLCEGSDEAQSIERCGLLANELIPNE